MRKQELFAILSLLSMIGTQTARDKEEQEMWVGIAHAIEKDLDGIFGKENN